MSHPTGISPRWHRTISRKRRRIRLRTTAPPSAFLMLTPKRLRGNSLARKNTVKWELERRFPVRYTASNSPRFTSRASRGNVNRSLPALPGIGRLSRLNGGEPMTSLLAARCQHLAAAFCFHACAEPVSLGAAAPARLIRTLWQSNPPLYYATALWSVSRAMRTALLAVSAADFEILSVCDPRAQGQERLRSARMTTL